MRLSVDRGFIPEWGSRWMDISLRESVTGVGDYCASIVEAIGRWGYIAEWTYRWMSILLGESIPGVAHYYWASLDAAIVGWGLWLNAPIAE